MKTLNYLILLITYLRESICEEKEIPIKHPKASSEKSKDY
jgi:hypothetical protein